MASPQCFSILTHHALPLGAWQNTAGYCLCSHTITQCAATNTDTTRRQPCGHSIHTIHTPHQIEMTHLLSKALIVLATAAGLASCADMKEDLPPCPQGLDIHFKYNYNLQRADMFTDHVGAVSVYLFDANGHYLEQRTVQNTAAAQPLNSKDFCVHFDIAPGTYQYQAVAFQRPYAECQATAGARFKVSAPQSASDNLQTLRIALPAKPISGVADTMMVDNAALPLDTLWVGQSARPVTVRYNDKLATQADTCSLVRDTKQINITLRDLDNPADLDVNDFTFTITDRNAAVDGYNTVDERTTLRYTPYATWNTTDPINTASVTTYPNTNDAQAPGRMAHADFMTSRIIYHSGANAAHNAQLVIYNKRTQQNVVRIDLADFLQRLRSSAERNYTAQEFLDRGYDYRLSFYLKGGSWSYASIEIGVLSWAVRIQNEDI